MLQMDESGGEKGPENGLKPSTAGKSINRTVITGMLFYAERHDLGEALFLFVRLNKHACDAVAPRGNCCILSPLLCFHIHEKTNAR
jgi:hypothetical protein